MKKLFYLKLLQCFTPFVRLKKTNSSAMFLTPLVKLKKINSAMFLAHLEDSKRAIVQFFAHLRDSKSAMFAPHLVTEKEQLWCNVFTPIWDPEKQQL